MVDFDTLQNIYCLTLRYPFLLRNSFYTFILLNSDIYMWLALANEIWVWEWQTQVLRARTCFTIFIFPMMQYIDKIYSISLGPGMKISKTSQQWGCNVSKKYMFVVISHCHLFPNLVSPDRFNFRQEAELEDQEYFDSWTIGRRLYR